MDPALQWVFDLASVFLDPFVVVHSCSPIVPTVVLFVVLPFFVGEEAAILPCYPQQRTFHFLLSWGDLFGIGVEHSHQMLSDFPYSVSSLESFAPSLPTSWASSLSPFVFLPLLVLLQRSLLLFFLVLQMIWVVGMFCHLMCWWLYSANTLLLFLDPIRCIVFLHLWLSHVFGSLFHSPMLKTFLQLLCKLNW